jgi:tetratricopeptide (TPR) repeat protein
MTFQIELAWVHEQAFDFERGREICESVLQQFRGEPFGHKMGTVLLGLAYQGLRQYDRASDCFNEITNQHERMPMFLDWIFYLLLHHGLSLYWFVQREFDLARREAMQSCQFAAQSGERTYLALGRRTLAEIAMAERNYTLAEAELAQAIEAIKPGDTPLAQWRVWQTSSRLHEANGRRAEADLDWARSQAILKRFANSLGEDEPLCQHLLANLPMREW